MLMTRRQCLGVLASVGILPSLLEARSGPIPKTQTISFQGREHARASSIARSAGLTLRWTSKEQVILSGVGTTVQLDHDSRRIRINGIWVWLSGPVFMRDGEAFLPLLDVSKTLVPILSPKKVKQNLRTICIDPGHGGEDTGKRDGGRYEKTYTLLLAKELGRLLKSAGYRVVLTRTSDKSIELTDRPLVASRSKADLFVSLHFNGADVASAQGVEVYCMTPFGSSSTNAGGEGADSPTSPGNRFDERNVQLAFELQKLLVQRLEREDRGLRRARFAVLRDATMPAVLIEGGFMSNSAEARWIYSEPGRLKLAQSIVEALRNYKRNASL